MRFYLSPRMAALIALLCLAATPVMGATFLEKNFAQLVGEAEQIFVGTVSSLQSKKLAGGALVTDVRFSNLQVIKGEAADIVLRVLGGEVDGLRLEIPGLPQFQRDSRYLVFSQRNGKDMFPVVGGPAGLFQIAAAPAGGGSIALDWSGKPLGPAIVGEVLDNASSPAPNPPLTLELFLAAIRARLDLR